MLPLTHPKDTLRPHPFSLHLHCGCVPPNNDAKGFPCSCCCSYTERVAILKLEKEEKKKKEKKKTKQEKLTDSCAASIMGSWISVYILARAFKPPGRLYGRSQYNKKWSWHPLTNCAPRCLACNGSVGSTTVETCTQNTPDQTCTPNSPPQDHHTVLSELAYRCICTSLQDSLWIHAKQCRPPNCIWLLIPFTSKNVPFTHCMSWYETDNLLLTNPPMTLPHSLLSH